MRGRVVAISFVLAMPAHADTPPEQAKAAAEAAAARNDFFAAATKYREAYAADPRPEYMCNVGVAYYKAKDLPRAERYLDQCLVVGKSLDPAFLANVEKVERAVVEQLKQGNFTPVDLVVEPSTAQTLVPAHDDPVVGSRRIWVPFGSYSLKVSAEGFDPQMVDFEAKGREPVTKRITLARREMTVEQKIDKPATHVLEQPPLPRDEPPSKVPAWIATGATGVAALVTLGFVGMQRSNAAKARMDSDPDVYFSHVELAQQNERRSWYAGGAAGVCVIASAVLWYRVVF